MRAELTSATVSAAGGSWSFLGIVAAAAIGGLAGVVGVGLRPAGDAAAQASAMPVPQVQRAIAAPEAEAAPAEVASAQPATPVAAKAPSAPQPATEELPPGLDQLLAPPASPVRALDDEPGYRPTRPPRTRVGGKAPGPLGPWGAQR